MLHKLTYFALLKWPAVTVIFTAVVLSLKVLRWGLLFRLVEDRGDPRDNPSHQPGTRHQGYEVRDTGAGVTGPNLEKNRFYIQYICILCTDLLPWPRAFEVTRGYPMVTGYLAHPAPPGLTNEKQVCIL